MKPKVLVIPSWYATPQAPTSGSFFREQALLMESGYDVRVLLGEKRWISSRRHFLEKHIAPLQHPWKDRITNYSIAPPPATVFHYDFIKAFSEARNLRIQIQQYIACFQHWGWRPDIIHAHSAFTGGIIAQYLSLHFQIPYIVTEHFNPFLLHKYSSEMQQEIISCLEKADSVLAVSMHQRQQILMHQINCDPVVTGNLVNESIFDLAPSTFSFQRPFNVLLVAYYPNFIKDVPILFKALAILRSKGIQVQATILGGGELKGEMPNNAYTQLAKQYQVEELCLVIGKAERNEIFEIFAQTDALVSTSIAETFGVAICEAMLCGKPVVSTANGGVDDYLTAFNGIKVPIHNEEALAQAIIDVMHNYSTYDPQRIRNHIIDTYGQKAFYNRIDQIYQQLLQ